MTITLTLYAVFTKKDFTVIGGMLLCGIMVLVFGSFFLGFSNSKAADTLLSMLGVIIFSGYILYDT
jgi:FtsH-binding integral membrane protein